MARHKNGDWNLGEKASDGLTWEQASIAVLMDIRDELQRLNRVICCSNFIGMPFTLRRIEENTKKRARTLQKKGRSRV